MNPVLSRRQLLAALGLGAAGLSAPARALAAGTRTVARAAATPPAGSDLGAVDHVVFLMMENRSYDHYFGTYRQGRGFDDPATNFAQVHPGKGAVLPFHLDVAAGEDCTNDLTHDWGPMHQCWNGGRMDAFVAVHTRPSNEGANGVTTMGYYTRADLPFYYAAADAFTLCDGYHCAVLGPTHPNRLMANSGTMDPDGHHGGPVTDTNPDPTVRWSCTWTTVQEVLEDAGISWKVYHPSFADAADAGPGFAGLAAYPTWDPAIYNPTLNPEVMFTADHVLPYFQAFEDPASVLYQKAFGPTFPGEFVRDVAAGTLPRVSWLIPPLGFDEHPSATPQRGMWFTSLVLGILAAHPRVWSRTVFFLMYDENDGWFDHVPPPTPPPGTAGEELTTTKTLATDTFGIRRPLGLGVRVPMLVMSPFSRGGHIAPETFDHTSQLQFLHARFGIEVPNVSAWRRRTVGDLTSTLFRSSPDFRAPRLPAVPLTPPEPAGSCNEASEESELGGAHPVVPNRQSMPSQER